MHERAPARAAASTRAQLARAYLACVLISEAPSARARRADESPIMQVISQYRDSGRFDGGIRAGRMRAR